MLAAANLVKYLYLAWFSHPEPHRKLYRLVRRRRPARIVELGIGTADRALRMIAVAQRYAPGGKVSYVGIDLFEARPAGVPGLSLKEAYRRLRPTGAGIRLLPGDPLTMLSATANSLPGIDLMLISADQDAASLAKAWFYVPRMLHAGSIVLREVVREDQLQYEAISQADIARLAIVPRRKAA